MTVRYFMQIGEAKSICGTHVQSRTLELKAHATSNTDWTSNLGGCLGELHTAPDPKNQLCSKICQPNTTSYSSSTVDLLKKNGGAGPNSVVFME
jgi:hypothetical protein